MPAPLTLLILIAALATGLLGGLFFGFSNFAMKGLGRIPPRQGISAMQSMNITVLNPGFLGIFVGTAVLCLGLVVAWFVMRNPALSVLLPVSGLLYIVGCFVVTIAFNVPLNDRLAVVDPASAAGAELWTQYLSRWTLWNHVRTAASLAASAGFLLLLAIG